MYKKKSSAEVWFCCWLHIEVFIFAKRGSPSWLSSEDEDVTDCEIKNECKRWYYLFKNNLENWPFEILSMTRVYEGAPPGIHVHTVHAYDPGRKSVMYNLLDVRDHTYFNMDSSSGNISTAKTIDKVGDTYEIIAVAISQGETKLRQLQITVTDFNIHPPVFEHDVYRGELHVRSKVGATVLRVRALDDDSVPYNAEVYYKIDDPRDPRGRFSMDPQTGVLTLARSLEASPSEPIVELGVTAVDGGSPKRSDYARIEVLIKTISEPRDVRSANATGSTVQVCWTRPEYGQVLGYIVKYREVENPHGQPSFLNITSDATSKCSHPCRVKAMDRL
ncbi:adhesion G-protein coupled receptor G4 [Caerostris extrusa]|uniref:Adhesion G-protein coupled receptor G4 n=1 Tax=Caerostris extrusa TaxID=172846 RepID=A0AAV4RA79_CAEEX|nr:adhesion G-protein coupled receptor G4 [Caerostris extrusa]